MSALPQDRAVPRGIEVGLTVAARVLEEMAVCPAWRDAARAVTPEELVRSIARTFRAFADGSTATGAES